MFMQSHTPPTAIQQRAAGLILSHTPPGGTKPKFRPPADPRASAAAVQASRALRGEEMSTERKMPRGDSGLSSDGLPRRTAAQRLQRSASWVRVMACVTEFGSRLQFTSSTECIEASVAIGGTFTASLKRPSQAVLDDGRLGIGAVMARAQERPGAVDEIVAHDADLDTFFFDIAGWPMAAYPLVFELAQFTQEVTNGIVQVLKTSLVVPRPNAYLRGFETAIEVPMHDSYPGGHAAQAMATAVVLGQLMGGGDEVLQRWLRKVAIRVAEVREIAGLHYPIDTIAGLALGDLIGSAIVDYAQPPAGGSNGWLLEVQPEAASIVNAKAALAQPTALNAMPLLQAQWQLAATQMREAQK